jgi:hypothetical protein
MASRTTRDREFCGTDPVLRSLRPSGVESSQPRRADRGDKESQNGDHLDGRRAVLRNAHFSRNAEQDRRQPAGLPVELPTGLEIVLDLMTAKALGLGVPRIPPARACASMSPRSNRSGSRPRVTRLS